MDGNISMKILSRHILSVFAAQFAVIFVVLVGIFSVATLIRLADLTAIAEVGIGDMLTLFALTCPQIVFYCLPLSLFAAATLSLASLSSDREITAMISLGANKRVIAYPLIISLTLTSVLLLMIGLWLVPAANVEARNLVEVKKAEITVSIHPGEGAQRFGEWLAFASSGKNAELNNVTLFSSKKDTKLIFADHAAIDTTQDGIRLKLDSGIAYRIDELKPTVGRLDFESLTLIKKPPSSGFEKSNIIEYWLFDDDKRKKDFANTVLGAVFPIASIFFILAIGLYHPRFRKSHAGIFVILVTTAYYIALLTISPYLLLWAMPVTLGLWILSSYIIMKKVSVF